MKRLAAVALSAVVALALTACSPSSQPILSSRAEAESPSPSPSSDTVAAQVGDGHSCEEVAGDGGSNDLGAIALSLDANYLTVTFELAQPVQTDDAMVGLNVLTQTDDDPGYEMHQLGVKWLDGQVIGFFDFSFKSATQENFDYAGVVVEGQRVTVKWPASIIDGLGDDWRWFAFATHNGSDTDTCPGAPLSFETLTYKD